MGGGASEAAQRTVSRASLMAAGSPRRISSSSAVRGARGNPPTRTLTGWIGRPPRMATIRLPSRLRRRPRSTTSRVVRGQLDTARGTPGSPGRAASRCAVRGSRSTRRRRGVAGGGPPGRSGRQRGPRRRGPRTSDRRPDRCRRCAPRCPRPRPASADDQALEVARRLEDLQMGLRHLPVTNRERQPTLALDSRQLADVDLDLIGLAAGSVLTGGGDRAAAGSRNGGTR